MIVTVMPAVPGQRSAATCAAADSAYHRRERTRAETDGILSTDSLTLLTLAPYKTMNLELASWCVLPIAS